MARIIGELGSEKILIEELRKLNVTSLSNLAEVEDYIENSGLRIEKLKEEERNRICKEIDALEMEHCELIEVKSQERAKRLEMLNAEQKMLISKVGEKREPTKNPFKFIIQIFRHWRNSRRLTFLNKYFLEEVERPFRELNCKILELENIFIYLDKHKEEEVLNRLASQISEHEKVNGAIEQVKNWVIGARGEREVLLKLSALPDSFVIINDVILRLKPPLKLFGKLRFQCQADHIVIGPSGVFNIETKYWSEESVKSLNLRSPVEQIKLTGKGLWRELNNAVSSRQIKVNGHHWGETKIQVRNILAMVGAMPNTEFQFVKILPVERLQGYLEFFEPVYQDHEVESIANWFTRVLPLSEKRSA